MRRLQRQVKGAHSRLARSGGPREILSGLGSGRAAPWSRAVMNATAGAGQNTPTAPASLGWGEGCSPRRLACDQHPRGMERPGGCHCARLRRRGKTEAARSNPLVRCTRAQDALGETRLGGSDRRLPAVCWYRCGFCTRTAPCAPAECVEGAEVTAQYRSSHFQDMIQLTKGESATTFSVGWRLRYSTESDIMYR